MIALMIIDMQNDFVQPDAPLCIPMAQATIPAIKHLLDTARHQGWTVVHVVRQHRADGSDCERHRKSLFTNGQGMAVSGTEGAKIISQLTPLPDEIVLHKTRHSAFMNTPCDGILRRLGISTVVIAGTQYPNCIRATANDAMSLDYKTIIVTDACSAKTEHIANANILDMQNMGIACVSTCELDVTLAEYSKN